jgi:RNA polymerase sigma factor (TIGR02999 family)
MDTSPGTVTRLLVDASDGNQEALSALIPLVYDELRAVAARHLRSERSEHTLQATALVHEVYLRLIDQKEARWRNRAHFFAIAAMAMRRVLVDHARAAQAAKRGGPELKLPLDEAPEPSAGARSLDLVALDRALERLTALDSRLARIVELRYFGGLTVEETAEVTGVSARTVKREWRLARAWLRREMFQEEA